MQGLLYTVLAAGDLIVTRVWVIFNRSISLLFFHRARAISRISRGWERIDLWYLVLQMIANRKSRNSITDVSRYLEGRDMRTKVCSISSNAPEIIFKLASMFVKLSSAGAVGVVTSMSASVSHDSPPQTHVPDSIAPLFHFNSISDLSGKYHRYRRATQSYQKSSSLLHPLLQFPTKLPFPRCS